jgi:hypothetical protein
MLHLPRYYSNYPMVHCIMYVNLTKTLSEGMRGVLISKKFVCNGVILQVKAI